MSTFTYGDAPVHPTPTGVTSDGITKREYFAALIMASCYSSPEVAGLQHSFIAENAVNAADALIDELNKP